MKIRHATRLQYSRIAEVIDADEIVRFGLYKNGSGKPDEWHELTKNFAVEIQKETPSVAMYHGEIQGIVHSFYKETRRPKLVVKELSTNTQVNCFFKIEMYHSAVEALQEREAVIFVEGEVTENLSTGLVQSIEVTDFRPAPLFDKKDFGLLIGCAPNLTGRLTTEKYIERFRENADF